MKLFWGVSIQPRIGPTDTNAFLCNDSGIETSGRRVKEEMNEESQSGLGKGAQARDHFAPFPHEQRRGRGFLGRHFFLPVESRLVPWYGADPACGTANITETPFYPPSAAAVTTGEESRPISKSPPLAA